MTRTTQTLVLCALGALLLRLGFTQEHLSFVNAWMRWPLVATGLVLALLGIHYAIRDVEHPGHHDAEERPPHAAWLLLLPFLVAFLVAPQPLGAYVAERSANPQPAAPAAYFAPLPEQPVVPLKVTDFVVRAQFDPDRTLAGRTVALTGFVVRDGDDWYVARITINCCAADAVAYRVRVDGATAPPSEQWVTVTGTWRPPATPQDPEAPLADPDLSASDVVEVAAPAQPYE